jgi:hypothetical protein
MNHSAVGPINNSHAVPHQGQAQDELIRVFNTALLATQANSERDHSREIFELMETPAFRAILGSVRQFARLNGLTERQAAEQIIHTFRKVDQVWRDYVFHEGVERIKGGG